MFDVPAYQGQPSAPSLPSPTKQYALDSYIAGAIGKATTNLNMRTYPNTTDAASIMTNLPKDTPFKVLGENGGWFKVSVNGQEGWVFDDYVQLENGLQIVNMNIMLNVRSEPSTTAPILGTVKPNGFIIGTVDDKGEFKKNGAWYQVIYNGKTGWVHGDYIVKKMISYDFLKKRVRHCFALFFLSSLHEYKTLYNRRNSTPLCYEHHYFLLKKISAFF
ncbi:SH3 domain-containing protein [Lysinibacillus sp. MHQ-1]|nr:SH3 domain-containing protein [Lysinibacillus sp. MHQ-1]